MFSTLGNSSHVYKITTAVFYKMALEKRGPFKDMSCKIAIILGLTLELLSFQVDKFCT